MRTATMNLQDVMAQLKVWGSPNARKLFAQQGAGDNQFGVTLGKLRGLGKKLKSDHQLAMKLWTTENVDAMILATMLMTPAQLSAKEAERNGTASYVEGCGRGVGVKPPYLAQMGHDRSLAGGPPGSSAHPRSGAGP